MSGIGRNKMGGRRRRSNLRLVSEKMKSEFSKLVIRELEYPQQCLSLLKKFEFCCRY